MQGQRPIWNHHDLSFYLVTFKPPFIPMNNKLKQASKARFRISLLLLTGLLFAKLFWTPGNRISASNDSQTTAQADGTAGSFTPVGDENAQVWGLAGSLLNLFSGRTSTPDEQRREYEQRAADERANQQRWGEEYEERRQEERDQKEQDWADDDRRRQADQEHYDRQQQQQDNERQQQQQEYYDKRQQEQGF